MPNFLKLLHVLRKLKKFLGVLVKNNQVWQYLKFMILSMSHMHIHDWSRPDYKGTASCVFPPVFCTWNAIQIFSEIQHFGNVIFTNATWTVVRFPPSTFSFCLHLHECKFLLRICFLFRYLAPNYWTIIPYCIWLFQQCFYLQNDRVFLKS